MTVELCSTARTHRCAFAACSQLCVHLDLRPARCALSVCAERWPSTPQRTLFLLFSTHGSRSGRGARQGLSPEACSWHGAAGLWVSPERAFEAIVQDSATKVCARTSSSCHAASPAAACRCPTRASPIRNITALPSSLASSLRRRPEQRMPENDRHVRARASEHRFRLVESESHSNQHRNTFSARRRRSYSRNCCAVDCAESRWEYGTVELY